MHKYHLIIFDLDGTLADTSAGIYECHRYANISMGRPAPTDTELNGVIGGPLLRTYKERFAFSDDDAAKAVKIYRERYSIEGIKGSTLYDGMLSTLEELKKRGFLLAVATLKAERLAKLILSALGAEKCFDAIHGVDDSDKLTKSKLIDLCMNELNVCPDKCVLVGDSVHDATGARASGIDFIACTYGFGFLDKSEISDANPVAVIASPSDLLSIL